MRFKTWSRVEPYIETSRKRTAVLISQRRKRAKFPLLAPLIAETQPTVDAVMAQRKESWPREQQQWRDQRAEKWRKARSRLFAYGDNMRATIRECWSSCPYPADPSYFLDLLLSIDRCRIDPSSPPWRITPEEGERMRREFNARLERMREKKLLQEASASVQVISPSPTQRVIRLRSHGFLTAGDHG
jgi:hypothetical protein